MRLRLSSTDATRRPEINGVQIRPSRVPVKPGPFASAVPKRKPVVSTQAHSSGGSVRSQATMVSRSASVMRLK
jgi:hypothetical protein